MKQNNLPTCFWVCVQRAIDGAIYNVVSFNWQLPIIRVDANADHYVTKFLSENCRLNFLRLIGLCVSKVRWPKQNCGAANNRFDQSLSCIQLEFCDSQRDFTEVGMRKSVIPEFVPVIDYPAHKIRISLSILANNEESGGHVFLLEYVENGGCPSRIRPIV